MSPPDGEHAARHEPSLQLQIDVAVLKEQVAGVDKKLDGLVVDLRDTYARKTELKILDDRVSKLADSINWAIKIVLGMVIVGVVGLVLIKGGGVPR